MKAHEFASLLLDEHDVAVAPGSAFGSAGANHVRLALTTATDEIAEGVERIADFARTCCA
ncbi:hypothetical protein [Bounagaea algeriensis]